MSDDRAASLSSTDVYHFQFFGWLVGCMPLSINNKAEH